ncbi:hypothetical protein ARMGADRAFT_334960 [Armillaria gallica]|uniref:Uncharacterized protein n=1 Tax=Armillaria gallica TaxID=47427 RepID=A0A2H3DJH3_ARMGA|nr:hypothetical protein ARMGADRAFT_334960 [Armillaria gallica]
MRIVARSSSFSLMSDGREETFRLNEVVSHHGAWQVRVLCAIQQRCSICKYMYFDVTRQSHARRSDGRCNCLGNENCTFDIVNVCNTHIDQLWLDAGRKFARRQL